MLSVLMAWGHKRGFPDVGWFAPADPRGSSPRRSSLTEGPCNLLLQRLDQILERGALVGLNENVRRHSGNKMNVLQAGDLLPRQRNANRIIWLTRLGASLLLLACHFVRHSLQSA